MESVKAPDGAVLIAVVDEASCSVDEPPEVTFVFPELVVKLKL